MAKNKKPLLNEGTVRRMMKLANMDALGDNFITEKYTSLDERGGKDGDKSKTHPGDEDYTGKKGLKSKTHPGDKDFTTKKGDKLKHDDGGYGEKKRDDAFINEEEDELEMDMDVEAEEEVIDEPAPEAEGEVTITDEEAQDIIDLADKLKDAVGEGGEEVEAEEEVEMEGPGGEMEMGAEEEVIDEPGKRMYEEGLYEAALQGLNIDLVDDKAERRKAVLQEVKSRIYKRVVNRLLKESQAPKKRRPQQRRRKRR